MKRKSQDPITNLTEKVSMNFNLLVKLAPYNAANEEKQERFRTCVLINLSRIDAKLTQILGCQLAQYWPSPKVTEELRNKYIKEVEEQIDKSSQTLGLKMVRYIHEVREQPERRFDRRKRWWGWEI